MIRNNNPGNVRCNAANNWQGQTGCSPSGFVIFSDLFFGVRAMMKILINDIVNGTNTITKLITEYAPPSENNTAQYILNVVSWSGVGANEQITGASQLLPIVNAMIKMETSETVSPSLLQSAYNEITNTTPNPSEGESLFSIGNLITAYSLYRMLT